MASPQSNDAPPDSTVGKQWSTRARVLATTAFVVVGGALITAAILMVPAFQPVGPGASVTLTASLPPQTSTTAPSATALSSTAPSATPPSGVPNRRPSTTAKSPPPPPPPPPVTNAPANGRQYSWHTGIVAVTFWVGEIFDPNAPDGSQVLSTYDSQWLKSFGGCDGSVANGGCETERRTASNGYFPTQMTPKENPFYLDLPFDDLNNKTAFKIREDVIPWAGDAEYLGSKGNQKISLMKNRWVRIFSNGKTCYGQIEDAGPGVYDDVGYVFGSNNARPANTKFNNAGLDVSPALNGCLGFKEVNGQNDIVSWQFVDFVDVPHGPWRTLVTTSGVRN